MTGILTPAVLIDDALLPLVSLSRYAGLSVRRLRQYLTDRKQPLPHYRVGGKVLVRAQSSTRGSVNSG